MLRAPFLIKGMQREEKAKGDIKKTWQASFIMLAMFVL
jgi:hypothetical protein